MIPLLLGVLKVGGASACLNPTFFLSPAAGGCCLHALGLVPAFVANGHDDAELWCEVGLGPLGRLKCLYNEALASTYSRWPCTHEHKMHSLCCSSCRSTGLHMAALSPTLPVRPHACSVMEPPSDPTDASWVGLDDLYKLEMFLSPLAMQSKAGGDQR